MPKYTKADYQIAHNAMQAAFEIAASGKPEHHELWITAIKHCYEVRLDLEISGVLPVNPNRIFDEEGLS